MYRFPIRVHSRCIVSGPKGDVERFFKFALTRPKHYGFRWLRLEQVYPTPRELRRLYYGEADEGICLIAVSQGRPIPSYIRLRPEREYPTNPETAKKTLELFPRLATIARKAERARAKTGYTNRDDWQLDHWGIEGPAVCKNLINTYPLDFVFESTAGFPVPIFEAYARMFPSLTFECRGFDKFDRYAAEGFFNPREGQKPFALCEPSEGIQKFVCGPDYDPFDDPYEDETDDGED